MKFEECQEGQHVIHGMRGAGIVTAITNGVIIVKFDTVNDGHYDRDWFRINPDLLRREPLIPHPYSRPFWGP